jgi:RNA binding exosome subunit
MKGRFRGLHARVFVHATEDLQKVKIAMANVVGPLELTTLVTEGVHGNSLTILEANVYDPDVVPRFFSKLDREDLQTILRTLDKRVDEGCNLFVKIDKQSAFLGQVRLDRGDDVISVRIRVAAFPASCDVAQKIVSEIVEQELAQRNMQTKAGP